MKNNLSYYKHAVDSHNHWKFKILRRKYGWEGEGKFWALNNIIAKSDNCELDLSHEDKKIVIAAELDFELEEFNHYLEYLIHKCKLVHDKNGSIRTSDTGETLEEVNKIRERQRDWKKKKSTVENNEVDVTNQKSTSTLPVSNIEKEQSKVKKSKVNKITTVEDTVTLSPSAALPVPKEKKVGKVKKEKPVEPHWPGLVETIFDFNIEKFNEKIAFDGIAPAHFKRIVIRLRKRAEDQKKEWTEVLARSRIKRFLETAYSDQWLRDHFTLKNLDSQYQAIVNRQNGTHQQTGEGNNSKSGNRKTAGADELTGRVQEKIDALARRGQDVGAKV